MTPQDFKNNWTNIDEPLSPLTGSRLDRFNLQQTTADFLMVAGLPAYSEPNLSFANDTDDIVYGINKLTEQFDFEDDKEKYDKYIVIGSCRLCMAIRVGSVTFFRVGVPPPSGECEDCRVEMIDLTAFWACGVLKMLEPFHVALVKVVDMASRSRVAFQGRDLLYRNDTGLAYAV